MGRASLTWLSHAGFRVDTPGGKVVLIDPWLRSPKAPAHMGELTAKADAILVTHGHGDHAESAPELARRTGATVFCSFELSFWFKAQGLEKVQPMGPGGALEHGDLRITMTQAVHGASFVSAPDGCREPDLATGFVLGLEDGRALYHAGDTGPFRDMETIRELYHPELAMLPIGSRYTMGPQEAALAVRWLDPRLIVPMHYGTFPLLPGTAEAFREALPEHLRPRLRVLDPGGRLEL